MSKKHPVSVDERIRSALNACIGKMADRLMNTFNPEEKDSLSLFKQFCSALKTRIQWLKDEAKKNECTMMNPDKAKGNRVNTGVPSNSGQTWTERMLNRINPNHPLQPKDLNNGLVITR